MLSETKEITTFRKYWDILYFLVLILDKMPTKQDDY